jgi:type II secretory pathway predicted ATPase ExeA
MERTGAVGRSDQGQDPGDSSVDFVLPSRFAAIESVRAAFEAQAGPVLLTGDAGVGKTWLCRRLAAELPGAWRWNTVDLTPSLGPAGFYRLVLRGLGLAATAAGETATARGELEDALFDAAVDGVRWALVVDEAHNGSDDVLEEVRVLGNRLGTVDAFATLVLVGQNALARRVQRRPLVALGLRIACRVHLRPLEFEELRDALRLLEPCRPLDLRAIERLHRSVGGNPRLAFRHARPVGPATKAPEVMPRPLPEASEDDWPTPPASQPEDRPPLDLSAAVPARPPLQVGDGVIEVGWDASQTDPDPDPAERAYAATSPDLPARSALLAETTSGQLLHPVEELVEDRYAALQAWNEWDRTQPATAAATRRSQKDEPSSSLPEEDDLAGDFAAEAPDPEPSSSGCPEVRAEPQHGFAPYSQLFSRLRLPNDTP